MFREHTAARYTILLRWLLHGGPFPLTFRVGVRVSNTVSIMDFTPKGVEFTLYDRTYKAASDIPLGLMQKFKNFRLLGESLKGAENEDVSLEPLLQIFDELLEGDDAAHFRAGVNGEHGKTKIIGIKTVMQIIPWLLEQYGLRPTQPSSPSSIGSNDGDTGTSSTDGAALTESPS